MTFQEHWDIYYMDTDTKVHPKLKMKTDEMSEKDNVKMNLTLPKGFYELLQQESKSDFMKTATWVKRFLMKHLLLEHKKESKGGLSDEKENKN